jgi:hypothetical protein
VTLNEQILALSQYVDALQADGKLAAPDHSRLQVMLIRLRTDIEDREHEVRSHYEDDMEYYT